MTTSFRDICVSCARHSAIAPAGPRPVGVRELWHARYRDRDRRRDDSERRAEACFVARSWTPATVRAVFAAAGPAVEAPWGTSTAARSLKPRDA